MEEEVETLFGLGGSLHLFRLPEIVLEKILTYLSYEELAHLRIVCRRFNQINMALLNKGFRRVERFQAKCLKEVKSQLPRRESERRNHPLYRHCDILTAIETRLSLLNMTFIKYVDCQMCCFIPGKVIDELYRVLRFVQNNKTLPRAHEILTEFRDISSMAMEHFEEKIIKTLKTNSITPPSPRFSLASSIPLSSISSEFVSYSSGSSTPGSSSSERSSLNKPLASSPGTAEEIQYLISSHAHNKNVINSQKKEVSDLKSKIHDLRRKVSEQERVALEQNRILSEQTSKIIGQEAKYNEVNRKLLEYEQRFTEIFSELAKMKEESSGSSSSGMSSLNWQANNKNSKYYVSHAVASTPPLGSTLFVAGSMMQPNLVPLNLAAAQMSASPYLTSSQLGAYSFSMDPSTDLSPTASTSAVYTTPSCKVTSDNNTSQPESASIGAGSNEASTSRSRREVNSSEMHPPKALLKKRSKRKCTETEGRRETFHKKKKVEDS